jgi:glycosyltransferase involved in cell wall biosynthesis
MRVLMLSRPDVYDVIGGDTIQMDQTKKGLEKLGVNVQASTLNSAPRLSDFDLIHLFNWEQLEPFLDQHRAEVLDGAKLVLSSIFWYHTGQWFDQALISTKTWRFAARAMGQERAQNFYESWQELKFRRGVPGKHLRNSLSIPAQVLPNSRAEIEHLESVLKWKLKDRSRYTIVPNGIARELFDPLPPPNKEFQKEYGLQDFVLQVGRIQAAKNQLGLIRALADTNFPIVFIGQPSPYEKEYVECCYELGRVRGNVYFIGPKPMAELLGIYVLAALHVLPSWRETPGLVSLEAAAAGCRIVSTSIGSAREYFGDLACYCNPRDPVSIRQAVLQALAAPRMDALRQRVMERFTWEIAAHDTLEAYQKTLGESDQPAISGL